MTPRVPKNTHRREMVSYTWVTQKTPRWALKFTEDPQVVRDAASPLASSNYARDSRDGNGSAAASLASSSDAVGPWALSGNVDRFPSSVMSWKSSSSGNPRSLDCKNNSASQAFFFIRFGRRLEGVSEGMSSAC